METNSIQTKQNFIRPDRQESFGGKPSWQWPAPEHNHAVITVDRVGESTEGGPHRFTIRLGDTVKAFFSHDKQEAGVAAGISHARDEVRVRFDGHGDCRHGGECRHAHPHGQAKQPDCLVQPLHGNWRSIIPVPSTPS